MYQDLSTRHDLLIRLKGTSKRTSGNSSSLLGAQNKNLGIALQTSLTWVRLPLRHRLGLPKNAEKCWGLSWGFTVADPGEGPGGSAPPPPPTALLFQDRIEARRAENKHLKTAPAPFSKGLVTAPPLSLLFQGLDPALGLHEILQFTSKEPQ